MFLSVTGGKIIRSHVPVSTTGDWGEVRVSDVSSKIITVLFSRRDDKPETDLRFHICVILSVTQDPSPSPIVVRFRFFYAGFELMGLAYGIYGSWK